MKINSWLWTIPAGLVLASCIASEPLGIECDIEQIEVKVDNPLSIFNSESQSRQEILPTERNITFVVKNDAIVGAYPTQLTVSPGARVFLLNQKGDEEAPFTNGDKVNYADEVTQTFVVRSEDNSWCRRYPVQFVRKRDGKVSTLEYHFNENSYRLYGKNPNNNNYYLWEESDTQMRTVFREGDYQWKNGNPGFKIANSSLSPMDYPTVPVKGGGPDGSDCLKLETKYAGKMGEDVGCPNASGSLFNGTFDPKKALASKAEAVKSTLFGVPFAHVPTVLEADIKLVSVGTAYDDNGMPFTDEPDFYCVIYDNENQTFTLDGGNVLTDKRIKGIARLPHLYDGIKDKLTINPIHGLVPGGDWQHVVLPVDYSPFDKSSIDNSAETRNAQIDVEKLNNYGYSLVIGASSSWQGASFNAFIGQCILLDNIKLTCNDPEGANTEEEPTPQPEVKDNTCELTQITLGNAASLFEQASEATQQVGSAMEYTFRVKYDADLTQVPVTFTYNETATMWLDGEVFTNGETVDFSHGARTFELRSEDGSVQKAYTLRCERLPQPLGTLRMTFNGNAAIPSGGKYYVWTEQEENLVHTLFAERRTWGTSNHGFSIFRNGQPATAYPVVPITGYEGQGVRLRTLDNSTMGKMLNKRFTAGSIFLGYEEEVKNLQEISAQNHRLGVPCKVKPLRLKARLKYKAGETYQNATGNPVSGVVDEPDFYCIVYKNTGGTTLTGENLFTSSRIVGVARLPHPIHGVGSNWTAVELEIRYGVEGLTAADFATGEYSLVIGATSSFHHDTYNGAIGSELCVDDIELVYEK